MKDEGNRTVSSKHRVLALAGAVLTVLGLLSVSVGTVSADDAVRRIQMTDDCDPTTFNAVLGPGACVGSGTTTFSEFIAELTAKKVVRSWAFNPSEPAVHAGQSLIARNFGGEEHTFTCVTQFGGGVVPILNTLSGNTTPAVLCPGESFGASIVPPGGTRTIVLGSSPQTMYECLIHPWMRATLRVKD
jgi:hypothetical protein